MNQLALHFDFPRARRSDPISSHMAAQKAEKFARGHAATILQCLKDHGAQTIDMIAKRTSLTAVQVARRLPELQREGYTEPTGKLLPSASGCSEREWKAT